MFSIEPITLPGIALTGFVKTCGQLRVNEVDGKPIHATAKFAELAEVGEAAYQHIYQAFAFVLPPMILLEMQSFGLELRVSGVMEGMTVNGLISASLWTWKRFLPLATHKDQSEWLIRVADAMFLGCFNKMKYFQDLQSTPQFNNTFALVRKA